MAGSGALEFILFSRPGTGGSSPVCKARPVPLRERRPSEALPVPVPFAEPELINASMSGLGGMGWEASSRVPHDSVGLTAWW